MGSGKSAPKIETLIPLRPLCCNMKEPTHGDYNINDVEGIDRLRERMVDASSINDWSHILADYISWGNRKISKNTGIFNMNAATDCPNAQTDNCQVPWNDCYAHKAENMYDETLAYRRRQEYLWDCLDADTWAKAFRALVSRKRNPVENIRFSEAGDFRHKGDIIKVDRIAKKLSDIVDVYTYSASDYLPWDHAEHFTVNQSNNFSDYGDRLFTAVPTEDDIPEDGIWCPHSKDKKENDKNADEAISCGECRACIDKDAGDIYITLH